MGLSNELISQFVKVTKDDKQQTKETTTQGTVVYDGRLYVKLDGSDQLTPVSTTTNVEDGERVTVLIKDHTATITGNISSPAARTDDVEEIGSKISEFEIVVADKVSTKELEVERGRIDTLVSDNVTIRGELDAAKGSIDDLEADNVKINETLTAQEADIKKLTTEKLDVTAADIKFATIESLDAIEVDVHNLEATYGEFADLTTDKFDAIDAEIKNLDTEKLSAESADLRYANIDFANITEAAVEKLFADSGIIKDIIVSEGKITGELVGVTIKGDLIEAGTLKADKLVVKGSDGIYYKLNVEAGATTSEEVTKEELENGLHGTAIIAKTITAEKIAVDDLVAFDATIGGFNITDKAIYSGVKESADNTTRGVYLDSDGQLSLGDSDNFLKYYKDQNGDYKLEISIGKKNIETTLDEAMNQEIGARNLIRNSTTLIYADYGFYSTVYVVDANIENGVLVLDAYSSSTSTFTSEIIDDVLTATEQYETEATVNVKISSDILSID